MDDRQDDRHAADRERKRHKRRFGPTTTNPGMRIVMRDLAHKAHEEPPGPLPDDDEGPAHEERRDRRSFRRGTAGRRQDRDKA